MGFNSLGQVFGTFERFGFVRVHKNHAVNARRVLSVRKREDSRDWELKLEPPVNRVLAVSRNYLSRLKKAYEGG